MTTPITILCVDDHPVLRRGIRSLLATEPDMRLVAEAASGEEAVVRFREHRPDVTLMDLRLTGPIDGIQVTNLIRKDFPSAKVLLLTTYAGDENVHRALDAGAAGYLLKDTLDTELLEGIRAVYKGRRFLSPVVAQRVMEHLPRIALTAREREVLALMARGMRNKEIGAVLGLTEDTARTHVQNILAKLGVNDRTAAVTTAVARGLLRID